MSGKHAWMGWLVALALAGGTGCDDDSGLDPTPGGDAGTDAGSTDAGGADAGDDGGMAAPSLRILGSTAEFEPSEDSSLFLFDPATGTVEETPDANDDTDSVVDRAGEVPLLLARQLGRVHVQDPNEPLSTLRTIDINPDDAIPDAGPAPELAANPQTVVPLASDRAYVVPRARDELVVIDTRPAGEADPQDEVDLSPLAAEGDMDGVDPSDAVKVGDRVYVTLARSWYDVATCSMQFEGSVLAVVDSTDDSLVDLDDATDGVQGIELDANVNSAGLVHDAANDRLLVVAQGALGDLDGGIEEIDLTTDESQGLVLTETELDGDVAGLAWVSETRAYVRLAPEYDMDFTEVEPSKVFVWNPSTGDVDDTPLATDVDGMLVHEDVLYLWSEGTLAQRNATTGEEIDSTTASTLPVFSAAALP
ncbi:MAG: hypothetical protein ACOCV4_03770 [Myxococcota bacterium]